MKRIKIKEVRYKRFHWLVMVDFELNIIFSSHNSCSLVTLEVKTVVIGVLHMMGETTTTTMMTTTTTWEEQVVGARDLQEGLVPYAELRAQILSNRPTKTIHMLRLSDQRAKNPIHLSRQKSTRSCDLGEATRSGVQVRSRTTKMSGVQILLQLALSDTLIFLGTSS